MKILLTLVRWVVGGFFCLGAIGGFLSGESGTATFVLLFGLIILPPVSRFLFKKRNVSDNNMLQNNLPAKTPVSTNKSSNENAVTSHQDVIDVTGAAVDIKQSVISQSTETRSVVPWAHSYIYAYSDLESADKAQKEYYQYFKRCFLSGYYPDLEGNSNYAFILLFDLLREFDVTKNISVLEKQLNLLGVHYTRTLSYTKSFLLNKMNEIGDYDGVRRLRMEMAQSEYNNYSYNSWGLGAKFKKSLNLDKESEEILNRLWYQGNNFYSVEYCQHQIIKLFISVVNSLKREYAAEQKTIEQQFDAVADVIARKQYRYRVNSTNYTYCLQSTRSELYTLILKYCENAIREHYNHKRKLAIDSYAIEEVNIALDTYIMGSVKILVTNHINEVSPPDEETEIELNYQNTNRWKHNLEQLELSLVTNSNEWFLKEVLLLGTRNKKNPSVENIFFEASKTMAKRDRVTALILYVHYIHHDLNSKTFDNRALTKTIQKSLFDNTEQVSEFETLIQQFIQTRNLKEATDKVVGFYQPKRKRIQLDQELIQSTSSKYNDTVELLNNFLIEEDVPGFAKAQQVDQEIKILVESKDEHHHEELNSLYRLSLNEAQMGLMQLFAKNNLSLPTEDINSYSKSIGVFSGQLIESINDIHFELLDDVLIEEDEDLFIINENYYKNILVQ